MPIIYDGMINNYYNPPKFGSGFNNHGFRRKKLAFNSLYSGQAFRDFGNNVVLGDSIHMKPEFKAEKKDKAEKEVKQQEALDTIIKKTARTKEDIIGSGFKMC
jgi:hypothetical protein